jgi:SH3/ankyrin repeat-containing protein
MLKLDEKSLKQLHTKVIRNGIGDCAEGECLRAWTVQNNLRKFLDYVRSGNAEKVEKACTQGLDPNYHDLQGETPLSIAAGLPNSRDVIVQLVGGGAHLDFRNTEGQTAMHKAAFCSMTDNVKALLELGASPNYKDPIGLTPLYYNLLSPESSPQVAELLLSEAADIGVRDMHANEPLHQVRLWC